MLTSFNCFSELAERIDVAVVVVVVVDVAFDVVVDVVVSLSKI